MTYSTYTKTGPFSNGASPGISAAFLNALETFCAAGWFDSQITSDGNGNLSGKSFNAGNGAIVGMYFLSTPYHLTTNPTLAAGSTTTLTCTGGSTGVPSGAKAVLLGIGVFSNTSGGGYVQGAPHGGTFGQYWGLTGPVANQYTVGGMVIAPLDATGKIDVKANAQSMVLQDWYIYGYII